MKKLVFISLCLLISFSIVSCGSDNPAGEAQNTFTLKGGGG